MLPNEIRFYLLVPLDLYLVLAAQDKQFVQ